MPLKVITEGSCFRNRTVCLRTVSTERMLVRPRATLDLPGRAAVRAVCPPPADLTLLCEWRTWLSVSCGNSAGDALAVTDEKRRGPPTLPGENIRLSCIRRTWKANPCAWVN